MEFSDFKGKQGDIVRRICEEDSQQNIILNGLNGNGKTMLMNIAMKELFKRKHEVYVIDFRHLMKEYISSWKSDETKIPRLLTVDYLGIDDLGKEFKVGDSVSSDLANATLDYVLRYRIQRNKPTWMTFNLALAEISKVYNGHIASLMKRNTTTIEFTNDDYGDNLITTIKSGSR